MADTPKNAARPMTAAEPPPDIVAAALRAAAHSPCRSKRGAALFTQYGLVVVGFNHRPDGCDGSASCKATCRTTAVHAEQEAIIRAGWMRLIGGDVEMVHVKSVGGALVPSGPPSCVQCSKMMLASGVVAMWLYHDTGWRRYPIGEFHALSLRGPGHPEPPAERRGAMLRAEWDEACYLAREDYTKDPHAHIEALITAGDAVLAALSAPPPGQDTAGLVEAVRRWQTAVSKNGSTAEECAEAAAADDELLAFPLPAPTEET